MEFSKFAGPVTLGYSGDGRVQCRQWIVDTLELGRGVKCTRGRRERCGQAFRAASGCDVGFEHVARHRRGRSKPFAANHVRSASWPLRWGGVCGPCSGRFPGKRFRVRGRFYGRLAPGAASSAATAAPQTKTKKSKKTPKDGKSLLGNLLSGTSVAAVMEGNHFDMEDLLMMAMVEGLTRSSLGKNAKAGRSSFDDSSSGTDGHAERLAESAAGVLQDRRFIQNHFQNAPLKVIDGKDDGKHPSWLWKAKEAARREAAARV